jgi:diguanylate cyclase (GGDEF)-like protein
MSVAPLRVGRFTAATAAAVLLCTLAMSSLAILAIGRLQADATTSRDAERQLVTLRLELSQIQDVPWGASPGDGDKPQDVANELTGDQQQIQQTIDRLSRGEGLPERAAILTPFHRTMTALWQIFRAVSTGHDDQTGEPSDLAARQTAVADRALQRAAKRYRAHSVRSLGEARIGSAVVIMVLFGGFAAFFWRSARARRRAESLAAENRRLAAANRAEAITDAMTGLPNRRALITDLDRACTTGAEQTLLVLLDLDGFKQYNDTFGHPAGDALLTRLAQQLAAAADGLGTAYRMGGDEFCVLARIGPGTDPHAITCAAAASLSDTGPGFRIGSSYGAVLIPSEAASTSDALRLADQRLYRHKRSGRVPASRQSADVLLALLAERSTELGRHCGAVSVRATATARRLGLTDEQVDLVRLAGELHDVGKAAIPDAILSKRGPLDGAEWAFMNRHPLIAERIVRAAPSLAHTAEVVRAHHEHYDGSGHPDGLPGAAIPLGARIIAVSDAFDAMISERPFRPAASVPAALAELRRRAGSQFDPAVVAAFAAGMTEFDGNDSANGVAPGPQPVVTTG